MGTKWLDRTMTANDRIGARIGHASDALIDTLRDANSTLAKQTSASWHHARAMGDDLLATGRKAGLSTRDLVVKRPLETVAIVMLLGIAVGWIMRRAQEPRTVERPRPPARRKPAR